MQTVGKRARVVTPETRAREGEALERAIRSVGTLDPGVPQTDKKNYGEKLSRALAQVVADALRSRGFKAVLPTVDGKGHESKARGEKGLKKLDVNYSTPQAGLVLGVSIKTINARDAESGRFTKNYSRVDNELRAEATDYHRRQPYAVLVAVLFLPYGACEHSRPGSASSFAAAIKYFRMRNHRRSPRHDPDYFENCYVALYPKEERDGRSTVFVDVNQEVPVAGPPESPPAIDFTTFMDLIEGAYVRRNEPRRPFEEETTR